MKYFLKSLLYIGIVVGGIITFVEYFGGSAATPAAGTGSGAALPSWLPSLSPLHMTYIAGGLVLLIIYFYLTRAVAGQAEDLIANKLVAGIGKSILIIGFLLLCRVAVDIVYASTFMAGIGLAQPWRWFWSVATVAIGALLPFQSLANWVIKTDGAFAKAVRRFVVVALLGVVLFTHAKEGRTLKDNYDDVKPFFAGIQMPELSKEKPPPPPPAPKPKEEKKIIAAAAKEKRWRKEFISSADMRKASSWSLPELPAIHFSMRYGQIFPWPTGGKSMCSGVYLQEGEFVELGSKYATRATGSFNCNRQEIRVKCVTDVCRGFAGYAFNDPQGGFATLVER